MMLMLWQSDIGEPVGLVFVQQDPAKCEHRHRHIQGLTTLSIQVGEQHVQHSPSCLGPLLAAQAGFSR